MTDKVLTCLWFENEGLGVARFYTSLIEASTITDPKKFADMRDDTEGVLIIDFTLSGAPYRILQAGPHQSHSDMASIVVITEDQAETDRLWDALTADGGAESQCGWLKDRWGIAWQIIPLRFGELAASDDAAKVDAMMGAMMAMSKLDMARLEAAYDAG